MLRVRHEVVQACRDYFYERGYINIDTPILTPAACEGTTTLFETDYFDTKAYLSQSGQLYLEPACMAFGKVYCFGPTFRAEKSRTRRHLTEFWMIEPEVAFLDLEGLMELAEDFLSEVIRQVVKARRAEGRAVAEAETSERITDYFTEIFELADPDADGADVTAREILDAGGDVSGFMERGGEYPAIFERVARGNTYLPNTRALGLRGNGSRQSDLSAR